MSKRKYIDELATILGDCKAPPLLVGKIAKLLYEDDNEFKIDNFREQVKINNPMDHEHDSGKHPFKEAFVPALQEFVRFWTEDMQKEFNVMNFAAWRVMMEEFAVAIEYLLEKDEAFSQEVDESQREYKEECEKREADRLISREKKREDNQKKRKLRECLGIK